jgi:hypothetical protein
MNRRLLLGIAGWLTVAAAATTAGVAAIDVLGEGITGKNVRPLDDEAVHRALSQAGTEEPAGPALSLSPSPSPATDMTKNLAAGGGTVTARCEGGRVTVLAATPSQGFRTGGIDHGPATSASLIFESAASEYIVTVTCENGTPFAHSEKDDGHHGGRGDRGGGRGPGQ